MIFRVLALILHYFSGLEQCLFLSRLSPTRKEIMVSRWHQRALSIFRVSVTLHRVASNLDYPPEQINTKSFRLALQGPCLIVVNHISWLDIHVIASQLPLSFVAKSDVMTWPVFGRFASAVNTIFLNRNKASDIKRVLKEIAERFNGGERICIFPEGTSSDGKSILPFKSNLFQAAVDRPVPVIPLLLQYRFQGYFTDMPGYYGDITLMQSFACLFKRPHIEAQITVLNPVFGCISRQEYCEQSRKDLLAVLQNNVASGAG